MKRKGILFLLCFFIVNLAFSIDTLDLENAILNYIPNSREKSFLPILQEYGFSESQIKSWRFTNSFIDQYYNQIYQVIYGNKFERISSPNHFIGTIRAVGEIKGNDLDNSIL